MSLYRCPECGFECKYGGICPCSLTKDHTVLLVQLPEQEDNTPVKYIERTGNTHRFCDQKTGKLIHVEAVASKKLAPEVISYCGREINTSRSCQYIVLTFIGERGIPFQDIIGYGTTRLLNLEKDLGKIFDIEPAPTGEKQVDLELTNEVPNG